MSEKKAISGSCLCGNVQFEITGPFLDFTFCHCERCRKAMGTAHSTHIFIDPKQVKWISGEKDTTLFLAPNADNYPRRFCNRCGSPVPRMARDGVRMVVPAGLLEDDPQVRPSKNIFWSLKAPWTTCEHNLPTFQERPK